MYITNHPSGTFNTERPMHRRCCGEIMINENGKLGVCILPPLHGRKGRCLPSPYLGR